MWRRNAITMNSSAPVKIMNLVAFGQVISSSTVSFVPFHHRLFEFPSSRLNVKSNARDRCIALYPTCVVVPRPRRACPILAPPFSRERIVQSNRGIDHLDDTFIELPMMTQRFAKREPIPRQNWRESRQMFHRGSALIAKSRQFDYQLVPGYSFPLSVDGALESLQAMTDHFGRRRSYISAGRERSGQEVAVNHWTHLIVLEAGACDCSRLDRFGRGDL